MNSNLVTMTAPADVVLAQFGDSLYVALRAAALRITTKPDTAWTSEHTAAPNITVHLAVLSCPCGATVEAQLHANDSDKATIARYCLQRGHCTFIRLPASQPPCGHWEPLPYKSATEGNM